MREVYKQTSREEVERLLDEDMTREARGAFVSWSLLYDCWLLVPFSFFVLSFISYIRVGVRVRNLWNDPSASQTHPRFSFAPSPLQRRFRFFYIGDVLRRFVLR